MKKNSRVLLLSLLLVVASAIGTAAQSTDRDNPTPLASGEIQGAGGAEKTSYYYTFAGGPGQVSATLEAKTKKGAKSASVGIELVDANAKSLTSTLLNEGLGGGKEKLDQLLGNGLGRLTSGLGTLSGDSKQQQTSSVKLKEKQTLMLRVTVGQGIETYSVKLAGAVEFGQPPTSPDATPAVTAVSGDRDRNNSGDGNNSRHRVDGPDYRPTDSTGGATAADRASASGRTAAGGEPEICNREDPRQEYSIRSETGDCQNSR